MTVKLTGTSGNDVFHVPAGHTLFDTIFDGGAGYDTLDLSDYSPGGKPSPGITAKLVLGVSGGYSNVAPNSPFVGTAFSVQPGVPNVLGTISNIEHLIGTSGNDYLTMKSAGASYTLDGGAGNDFVVGRGGNGTLIGGAGSDDLWAFGGNFTLVGGTVDSNGVAHGDGQKDTFQFQLDQTSTILDFEVGIDKLLIYTTDTASANAIIAAGWTGTNSATLSYHAPTSLLTSTITLNGVSSATANSSIKIGFNFFAGSNTAGDDVIMGHAGVSDTFVFDHGTGNDVVARFDPSMDHIHFNSRDIPTPALHDITVNGEASVYASWDNGASSFTISGLHVADLQYAYDHHTLFI